MSDESIAREICLLIANYLLLSTLLITLIGSVCKFGRIKSFALRDHLWKFAIVAPFLLIGIQSIVQPPGTAWNVSTLFEEAADVASERSLASGNIEDSIVPVDEQKSMPILTEELAQVDSLPFTDNSDVILSPTDALATGTSGDSIVLAEEGERLSDELLLEPVEEFDEAIVVVPSVSELAESFPMETRGNGEVANGERRPSNAGVIPMEPAEKISFSLSVRLWIVVCFAAAITLGMMKSLVLSCRVWLTLRRCPPIETGPLLEMTLRLQQQMRCKHKVTILQRSGSHEPAACGIWNWKILVPENLLQRLPAEEVEALIAHELAHLQRRDPLWGWMFQLVRHCFFWQPLNFLAVKQWRIAAEHCCDSQAVNAGIDRLTLARCLTSIAAWKLTPQPAIGVGVSTTALGRRVETLVDDSAQQDNWNHGWRLRLHWLFGVCLLAVMVLFIPRMSWTSEPESEVAAEVLDNAGFTTDDEQPPLFAEPISPTPQQALPENIPSQSNEFGTLRGLSIESEIVQVTTDLNYALTLLKNQEDDPEILAAISSLQQRIVQLKERVSKNNELAEASINKLPRDQKESAHEITSQSIGGTE